MFWNQKDQDSVQNGDSPEQNTKRTNQHRDLQVTWRVLCLLLAAGLLVVEIGFAQFGARAGVMALLWAFACLAMGFVGGFLFAVPRPSRTGSSQDKAQPGEQPLQEDDPSGLGVNTNLVEISDWLTKIFVGLGLFELRKLPGYIRRAGDYVGGSLGTHCPGIHCLATQNNAAASGLIIYFSGLGFLSGYLLTRLFLSPAFQQADRATRGLDAKLEETKKQAVTQAVNEAKIVANEAVGQAKVVAANEAKTVVIENAKIREDSDNELRPVENDINAAMLELAKEPKDRSAVFIDQLIGQLQNYLERFPLHRRLNIVLARLYADGKQSRQRAVDILRAFIAKKKEAKQSDPDLSDAYYNLACYYSLLMGMATGPIKTDLEAKTAAAVKESVAIQSGNAEDILGDTDMGEFWKSPTGQDLRKKMAPESADTNGADANSADANHDEKPPEGK